MPTARTIRNISMPPNRSYLQTVIKVGLGFNTASAEYVIMQDEIWEGTGRTSPTLDLSQMDAGRINVSWPGFLSSNFDYEVVSPFNVEITGQYWTDNSQSDLSPWFASGEEIDNNNVVLYSQMGSVLQDGDAFMTITISFYPPLSQEYGFLKFT
tara:strand:+ start:176 stop:637 length:462 start_codon:yes stop_codon:yes gene_type:complete